MTRKQNANEETPQGESAPPLAVPPGVDADYTVKFRKRVDPDINAAPPRSELEDLAELAGIPDTEDLPPDEISAFCHQWQNYAGQLLSVVRLPDPPERRLAGNSYARPCFNMERLGDTTFDPENLIGTLQFINNNSGGVFRVWLTYQGQVVPGARLERVAIGDPVGAHTANAQPLIQPQPAPAPAPQERQKSDAEIELEQVKNSLFTTALQRALNPPAPAQVATSGNGMSTEDSATLFLLSKTDFLGSIFGKMTELAQQAGSVAKEPSWKERALDVGLELATKNPAIVDRLSGTLERIVTAIFPPAKATAPQPQIYYQPQPPPQPAPWQQPQQPPPAPAQSADEPEAPVKDDEQEDETMDILDALLALVNSNQPLSLQHPVIVELYQRYPAKFKLAAGMIIKYPLENIIDWIKTTGGTPYIIMLDGPASGPFLRQRLGELQQLFIEGKRQHDEQEALKRAAQPREQATQSAPEENAPSE